MERKSRRFRSRSRSLSNSRSRSRDRDKRSRRNDHHRSSKTKDRMRSRSKSPHQQSNHSSSKSIIKFKDHKTKFGPHKKSVKFDESNTKNKDHQKKEKQKENLNASGALKRDLETTKNGVILKYNEPPEGTLCKRRWRLYVYKDDEQINVFYLHRKSFYLIGRDHRVTDIVCRHVSVSSQHAIIQYRRVKTVNEAGDNISIVKPYIMDLKSRHCTYLMGDKIEPYRFYELLPKDKIQFGRSTREYIVLCDDSNEKNFNDKSEIVVKHNIEQAKYTIWSDDDD